MKTTKQITLLLMILAMGYRATAQSTSAGPGFGNVWVATKFLGWGLTSGDLPFKVNNTTMMTLQNNTGFLGIGTTAPVSLFSVGASSQFQVNTFGDMVRIKNVIYSWPATQGAANTFLKNDGAGNLSWDVGTIGATPSAPVLISPADLSVGSFGPTTFTWTSASPCIVLYRIQVATDVAFSNIVLDQGGITDTTFSAFFCDTLPPVTRFWRVNAKNCATGPFSTVFSFTDTDTCKIATPVPAQPKQPSDSLLKTNIAPLTNGLDKVSQLNAVYFDWIHTNPNYDFDSTRQIGLIAQGVQTVIPEVVGTDINGFLTLDYGRLVPVLVEAIKDLKAQVNTLQGGGSKTTVNNNPPSTDAELASENSILFQNFPNPFGDGTIIRYFVTEKSASANMLFYDEFGNKIKTIELPHKGQNAELNLSTANLASGIYSYSLVVDGKIIATKNMVKTK